MEDNIKKHLDYERKRMKSCNEDLIKGIDKVICRLNELKEDVEKGRYFEETSIFPIFRDLTDEMIRNKNKRLEVTIMENILKEIDNL